MTQSTIKSTNDLFNKWIIKNQQKRLKKMATNNLKHLPSISESANSSSAAEVTKEVKNTKKMHFFVPKAKIYI
jgi:hypothetical protein